MTTKQYYLRLRALTDTSAEFGPPEPELAVFPEKPRHTWVISHKDWDSLGRPVDLRVVVSA